MKNNDTGKRRAAANQSTNQTALKDSYKGEKPNMSLQKWQTEAKATISLREYLNFTASTGSRKVTEKRKT